jgi:hypothetical protein
MNHVVTVSPGHAGRPLAMRLIETFEGADADFTMAHPLMTRAPSDEKKQQP